MVILKKEMLICEGQNEAWQLFNQRSRSKNIIPPKQSIGDWQITKDWNENWHTRHYVSERWSGPNEVMDEELEYITDSC